MSNFVSQTKLDAAKALLELRFFRSGNKETKSRIDFFLNIQSSHGLHYVIQFITFQVISRMLNNL